MNICYCIAVTALTGKKTKQKHTIVTMHWNIPQSGETGHRNLTSREKRIFCGITSLLRISIHRYLILNR